MARWKDKNGKALRDFPQPTLAVDVAVLTVPEPLTEDASPHLLLYRRDEGFSAGKWALPGTLVRKKERLAGAVGRALRIKAGVKGAEPVQLTVFDDPDRDARGWVMTVAHAALMPYAPLAAAVAQSPDVTLAPLDEGLALLPDRQRRLPFDNERIVELAASWAAGMYAAAPDPCGLLTPPFTLTQLRQLHQAIEGRRWQKDVFRRRVEDTLEPVGASAVLTTGRPAALLQLRAS
jgi:ADP-ribose pyrophosphatase YjhB (NUDIX family)